MTAHEVTTKKNVEFDGIWIPTMGYIPQNGWFTMENLFITCLYMGDVGLPPF